MRKKLLCGLILLLVFLSLNITTVQAETYTVGNKTITFEKFQPEGIDEEITGILDLKNNNDGILFGNNDKIYHMALDGTITEISEEEWEEWETKAWQDGGEHFYVEYLRPEIFSEDLPELTFVEGTEDNAGSYAVKIGDTIVSGYDYEETEIVTDKWYNAGNVIIGTGKNKITNEIDVWINTKTTGKLTTLPSEKTIISCDYNVLTLETFDDEGNGTVTLLDWDGNAIMSIDLTNNSCVWVEEFIAYNKKYYDVYTEDTSEVCKEYVYDANGNKILELEENSGVADGCITLFGTISVYSENTDSLEIIETKSGTQISPEIKCEGIYLVASTVELTNTSADYLAPGKYYYMTYSRGDDIDEDGFYVNTWECYVMTITDNILDDENSSSDNKNENELTPKPENDGTEAPGELPKTGIGKYIAIIATLTVVVVTSYIQVKKMKEI